MYAGRQGSTYPRLLNNNKRDSLTHSLTHIVIHTLTRTSGAQDICVTTNNKAGGWYSTARRVLASL